jgi:hypothetical protein
MWQAIGDVLGQAIGIALSPAAIIAIVLVLFSAKAKVNSLVFLAGWVIGVAVPFLIIALVSDAGDVSDSDSGGSDTAAVIQLVLGVLFLLGAAKSWVGRPRPGEPVKPNKLFDKVGDMGPGFALVLAFLMSGLNPKNLALIVSGATEAARADLSTGDVVVVTLVFVVVATLGVGVPVVLSLVMGERATATLTELRDWMIAHNAAIMVTLFLILGVKMVGAGISALA